MSVIYLPRVEPWCHIADWLVENFGKTGPRWRVEPPPLFDPVNEEEWRNGYAGWYHVVMYDRTRYSFRHKEDAALFKLMWHEWLEGTDPDDNR